MLLFHTVLIFNKDMLVDEWWQKRPQRNKCTIIWESPCILDAQEMSNVEIRSHIVSQSEQGKNQHQIALKLRIPRWSGGRGCKCY